MTPLPAPPAAVAASATPATALARRALEAMGGEDALRRLRVVRVSGVRQRNALEQSTRPTGPWIPEIDELVETRWLDAGALQDRVRSRGLNTVGGHSAEGVAGEATVVGDRAVQTVGAFAVPGGGGGLVQAADETLALGPERALLNALAAPDLHLEPDAVLNGYPHRVLAFAWRGAPVRVYLDPTSATPSAVEITRTRPFSIFWAPWGEVRSRTDWDVWERESGGLRYPHLWSTVSDDRPEALLVLDKVELDVTAAPPQLPQTPAPRRIDSLAFPKSEAVRTVAPGVLQVPGAWNILEIDQGARTFVVEGPISAAYSAAERARLSAGGRTLAGVITTSDSWPHIGGLRDYVAAGAPLHALDLNRPILERLFAAPHRTEPDMLARRPRAPLWRLVSRRTALGGPGRRIELIPLRTATGERQMAVWLPDDRLLYTSDLFQLSPTEVFTPETVQEMADVIARERLDVRTVVGMHYAPTPWSEVLKRAGLVR